MKALFFSDIHGSLYYANMIKEIFIREHADILVVLGDLYYHGPRNELTQEYDPMKVSEVLSLYKKCLYVIRGNCDAEIDEMISDFMFYDNLLLDINGKKVFCSHGHKYNIDNLPKQDFDVMAYGHFHTGFILENDGRLFINPGSISLPRNGSVNSYIIFDEKGIYLKDVGGNVIEGAMF
ncbi:MAG: phosphodiesterase [Bacilli bacterium]|nr:phosphodiesterase [Bacilli bacterium]